MSDSPDRTTESPADDGGAPTLAERLHMNVRPGERGLCTFLFALHFLVLAFQYTAKSVRQSAYIDTLGAEQLPFVYLLAALCSFPLLKLYGRLVDRFPSERVFALSGIVVGASMFLFWWLFSLGARWVSVVFYLWIAVVGILLVSQFWYYASHRLDARQARRLFGLVGAGGLLGSIAGGQVARFASSSLGTFGALGAAAALLMVLGLLVFLRGGNSQEIPNEDSLPGTSLDDEDAGRAVERARDGIALVRSSPYLRSIASIMLLSAMVAQVIDLQFSWVVEESTSTLDERTAMFGNLYSVIGVAALVFQLLFTSRIHRRWGVGLSLRALPVANGFTSLGFLAAAFFFPAFLLPAAWLLKIGENGLRYSLDQATRELLFLPVPARERAKAKAVIDVFVQRAAKGLAALALATVTFGWVTVPQTVAFSLVLIFLWTLLLGSTQRRYVTAFREVLLRRDLRPDDALDLKDSATLETLVEGLGSDEPRQVLYSLELLDAHGRGRLIPPLMLYHDDPEVRREVLRILAKEKRHDATPLVERLLMDPDPAVRVAAARGLAALAPNEIHDLMSERLHDPDPRMRAAALSFLVRLEKANLRDDALSILGEMIADGDPVVRTEGARALADIEEKDCQAELVQLLYDRDPAVVRQAIEAVLRRAKRCYSNPIYVPILVSHLRHRKLKHDARDALVAFGEKAVPALQHFMNDDGEDIWVRRALPKTLARIGGPLSMEALLDGLDAPDPFLRRKAIESLGFLCQRNPELEPPREVIEEQVKRECRGGLRTLLDLESLRESRNGHSPKNGTPLLLERLLLEKKTDHERNLFHLLALLHPPQDIAAARNSLGSGSPELRAHALEYLDNLLEGEVRQLVFTVIDDLQPKERQRLARKVFDLSKEGREHTLRRLASQRPAGDVDAAWLNAAALHYIFEHRIQPLYPLIRERRQADSEHLVQETCDLLLDRIAAVG